MPYKDPVARKTYMTAYDLARREKHRAAKRVRYAKNPEKAIAYIRNWRVRNPDKVKAAVMAWDKANPDKVLARSQRRRARKANVLVNDFTIAQWEEMQVAYNYRCAYCQKRCKGKLTQDHVTPLSKGGSHTLSNIVPACRSCNCRKKAGPVLAPIQPLLITISPSEIKEKKP